MKKHGTKDNDPLRDLSEWQDHRYNPGYFTGGNVHPLLKAHRPNKYGYFLLVGGIIILVIIFFGSDHILYWYYAALQMGLALLMITAGLKLIKKPRNRRPRRKKR